MIEHSRYDQIQPYVTRDGSLIRELMHPGRHEVRNQSLAEASVPPGRATRPHRHGETEELYHVTAGRGRMTLGEASLVLEAGDTVLIPPGTLHRIENIGAATLRVLGCCSHPDRHEDSELLDL